MYFACATLNATYSAAGALALSLDHTTALVDVGLTLRQWCITIGAYAVMFIVHIVIRQRLVAGKTQKGF